MSFTVPFPDNGVRCFGTEGRYVDWLPFLSYALVTTFTPGPNNLLSATLGGGQGYKAAFRFIVGVLIGFFSIMLVCSFFVERIFAWFPSVETPLKILGAAYILFLGYKVLRSKPVQEGETGRVISTREGILLQYANVKAILFGLTVTSSFIVPHVSHPLLLIVFSLFLVFLTFLATTAWALTGSLFRRHLTNPRTFHLFNTVMALLLLYSALSILGVL